MSDYIYDEETYPNCFSLGATRRDDKQKFLFEYSWRRNDLRELREFTAALAIAGDRMVGFNNLGFDYPVLHFILENIERITPVDIFRKADSIINGGWDNRFQHIIWDRDQHVNQVDLFKIHHFDNVARATGLKALEFNMRLGNIEDLPIPPGTVLNDQQCTDLINYMWVDIGATDVFCDKSQDQIHFREVLTEKYGRNFLNHNDTKIGKDFFIMKLEETDPAFNKRNQTHRDRIHVGDILFSYIHFERYEFRNIHDFFRSQTIHDTQNIKGVFKDIKCSVDGFEFVFGAGGIHGSVESQVVESDDDYIIEDWDVASYYPNLAIANGLFPEHLGSYFCEIYKDVYEERKRHPKGTAENAMLKLALNGVYGDSNNIYSPFYDPQYTVSITINGQLLLCMLAEQLMRHDQLQMIQINTDGLTVRYPRAIKDWVHNVAKWWEELTGLQLEDAEYSRMFIRDVNNYIGEYVSGKLKRKGAYCYGDDLGWHQDHSALVVPMAAEANLVRGTDIREFIENHQDIYDFMLRAKVKRSDRLVAIDYAGEEKQLQNITRYYISALGYDLVKIAQTQGKATWDKYREGIDVYLDNKGEKFYATTQGKKDVAISKRFEFVETIYEPPETRTAFNAGWKVSVCNDITQCNPDEIDFEWYIKEAEKLVKPLRRER